MYDDIRVTWGCRKKHVDPARISDILQNQNKQPIQSIWSIV